MGFWEHAFESFEDNVSILGSVAEDLAANINPMSDDFLSGNASSTAAEVERQRAIEQGRDYDPVRATAPASGGLSLVGDAASATGSDIKAAAGHALATAGEAAGGALDLLTNKWAVGAAVLVVVAILAAPYVVPAVKAATA